VPSPFTPNPAARGRRAFIAVNALLLAVGVLLSCSATIGAVPVYGRLTLGIGWAILQLAAFVASTWWYESRARAQSDLPDPPRLTTSTGAARRVGGAR